MSRIIIAFVKKRKPEIFFLAVFLFLSFTRLFWLAVGLSVLAVMYSLLIRIKGYLFLFITISFLGVVVLSSLTRLFIFEVYRVPSESMEDALFPGDYIVVSKLNYGPKVPTSPFQIPWVSLFINVPAEKEASVSESRRLGGFSQVELGDIVVFRSPLSGDDFMVKRCIGLPGETLQITDSKIAINGQQSTPFPTARHRYTVWLNDINMFVTLADSLNVTYNLRYKDQIATVILNTNKGEILGSVKAIDSIKPRLIRGPAYPNEREIGWSPDNLGPIIIPARGMKVALNRKNYLLYGQTIKNAEHVYLSERNGNYYINNKKETSYTFKHDYYFMMGDNRHNSNDSRFWGFLSEQNIEGKILFVLYSDRV